MLNEQLSLARLRGVKQMFLDFDIALMFSFFIVLFPGSTRIPIF